MKTRFFTLVELLVVIAIIGILAGLLFPVLGSASASADKAQCINNQRQTAAMLLDAMNANGGFLVNGVTTSRWTKYLYDTGRISDMKAFRCSTIAYGTTVSDATESDSALNYAFGVIGGGDNCTLKNGKTYTALDFRGTKCKVDANGHEVSPAQLLLGGCYSKEDVWIATTALYDAHRGETNVFCLDGHAQSIEYQTSNDLFCYMPSTSGAAKFKIK